MKVVANLVVDFGGGDGKAVLELDDKLNVKFFSESDYRRYVYYGHLPDNVEEETVSNFSPSDIIYFRLQYDKAKFDLTRITSTDGQVEYVKEDLRVSSQTLLWLEIDDTHTLNYSVNKVIDKNCKSYGNEVSVKLTDSSTVELLPESILPANYYLEYDAKFSIYRLHTPDVELEEDETYPITVVAFLESV